MTIVILGTSHIAKEAKQRIKKTINEKSFDCVAVELDFDRYSALKNKPYNGKKDSTYIDRNNLLQSIIISMLIRIQNKLSEHTGMGAGEEMLYAVNEAEKKQIPVKLIDQHINTTIFKISKISFMERFKFLIYLFSGIIALPFLSFLSIFSKKTIDLNKVPEKEMVSELISNFKKKFPKIFNILVEERNEIMSEKIKKIGEKYNNILVVVGTGHIEGIKDILKHKIKYNSG